MFVVIVNWNGWRNTVECLDSLYRPDYRDYRTVVVDNGPTDGSSERICAWADGSEVLGPDSVPIRTADYPTPARRPAYSALADRKFDLEQLNGMRPWEDALDDCLLRYHEALFHG